MSSAYISPDKQEIVVVLINTNSQASNIKLDFTQFTYSKSDIYETVYQQGGNKFTNIGSVPRRRLLICPGNR